MSMTDRELLELAAKAAGIQGEYSTGVIWYKNPFGDEVGFNPLNDDGDALRLVVKLDLLAKPAFFHYRSLERFGLQEADDTTATRRAIVRAAAELGRSMP